MVILGVDPGVAITGYGIIRLDGDAVHSIAYGTIATPSHLALPLRLQHLYRELRNLIDTYHPAEASVEELFFARNVRTALSVGHARGVILLALAHAGLPTYEYTPLQVKQSITGYGLASKEQMQQMVRLLLKLEDIPKPDDAADALAVAICHAHSFSMALRVAQGSKDIEREQ
nr:crossover junction endodeoxyribonuclease RuvC [Chloroflexota bacterium]